MNQELQTLLKTAETQELLSLEPEGKNLKILLSTKQRTTVEQEFLAEIFQKIFREKINVKNICFHLLDKEGHLFTFTLDRLETRTACASKNGAISLSLNREEAANLIKSSKLSSNNGRKSFIYAFDPENLQNLNHTIFYTKNLIECVIENP